MSVYLRVCVFVYCLSTRTYTHMYVVKRLIAARKPVCPSLVGRTGWLADCRLTADGGLYFEFFPRELGDSAVHEAVVEFFVGVAAAASLFAARTPHQPRVLTMTMTHIVRIVAVVALAVVATVASVLVVVMRWRVHVP